MLGIFLLVDWKIGVGKGVKRGKKSVKTKQKN
ncbi:hypothetical protein GvMRE_I2g582 [endosymbiont GvMRE of Glomus versiforme]|nr:hypothetical protein GvMRE_I2g582 [endosymbiont GvMRE of Glomus versiforme]